MDPATLIGTLLGIGVLAAATALGSSLGAFVDAPSLLIVIGGTAAATLLMESLQSITAALGVARRALFHQRQPTAALLGEILELSTRARRSGVLALSGVEVTDAFLARGVHLAALGLPREEVRDTLAAELSALRQRHLRGQKVFRFMGATAPAMGMIGTLVGLVRMLQTLNDPSSIGPAMAVALLTTLYGAVFAFLVCNPIAAKLERRSAEESAHMSLVIEGIEAIVKGDDAAVVQAKLEARLAPSERPRGARAAAALGTPAPRAAHPPLDHPSSSAA